MNTTVITATINSYVRVLQEVVQVQNSSRAQSKYQGIAGTAAATARTDINTAAATAATTTPVYAREGSCVLISTEFLWLSEALPCLFPKLPYLSVLRQQLFHGLSKAIQFCSAFLSFITSLIHLSSDSYLINIPWNLET